MVRGSAARGVPRPEASGGTLIAPVGEAFASWGASCCCGREGLRKRATPPSLRFLRGGRAAPRRWMVLGGRKSLVAQALGTSPKGGWSLRTGEVPARTSEAVFRLVEGPSSSSQAVLRSGGAAELTAVSTQESPASLRIDAQAPGQMRNTGSAWVPEVNKPLSSSSSPARIAFLESHRLRPSAPEKIA